MNPRNQIQTLFQNYIDARNSLWGKFVTFIFRNRELTEEKVKLATAVLDAVKHFKGSHAELNILLNTRKEEHSTLSRKNHKNHFNLDENRTGTQTITRVESVQAEEYYSYLANKKRGIYGIPVKKITNGQGKTTYIKEERVTTFTDYVKPGENRNRSDLAEVFHSALNSLKRSR